MLKKYEELNYVNININITSDLSLFWKKQNFPQI